MGLRRSAASLVAVVVVGVCIGNALAGQVAVKAHTAASWSAAVRPSKGSLNARAHSRRADAYAA